MSAVRVLVVDDSPVCRELLREVLEADGDIRVIAEVGSGREVLARIDEVAPDLVTMDVRMPGMDGLEAIARLMSGRPTPIMVVTEIPPESGDPLAFEATRRGALDIARKPLAGDAEAARALRARVRILARIPVVRHPGTPPPSSPPPPRSAGSATVIGIGASVGGPAALARVLGTVPASCAATLAVVQHIPGGFASAFARFLAGRTALRVTVATQPVALAPGVVVLPADDRHLVARGRMLVPSDAAPVTALRPSVDVLFSSLAEVHGPRALGVLLTGIGRDGAEGLAAMRCAGAETIAQDESTSTVWGMPRAAIERGAASRVLPLPAIARAIATRAGLAAPRGAR